MGLFFKDDKGEGSSTKKDKKSEDNTPPANNVQHKPTITITSLQNNGPESTTTESVAPTGGKKSEYMKFLKDLMIKNPGPYENLIIAIEKMKSQPIDEATKFKNVFSTLEAVSGITVEKLLSSAQTYRQLFDNTKASFDKDMACHKQTTSNQIEQLKKANSDIDKQMQTLNNTKIANEKKMQESQDSLSHLLSQENDFKSAHADSQAEIDRNVELIKQYLSTAVAQ